MHGAIPPDETVGGTVWGGAGHNGGVVFARAVFPSGNATTGVGACRAKGAAAMDLNHLTVMSRQAVTDAQAIARRLQHNEVDTWHVLSALLTQENGIVPGLLDKLAITPSAVQLAVDRELERLPKVSGSVDTSKVYVTQSMNEVFTKAEAEAKSLKDEYVSVEHLFLGLVEVAQPDALKKLFKSFGLDRGKLLKALKEVRGSQRVTTDNPEATYQALE